MMTTSMRYVDMVICVQGPQTGLLCFILSIAPTLLVFPFFFWLALTPRTSGPSASSSNVYKHLWYVSLQPDIIIDDMPVFAECHGS